MTDFYRYIIGQVVDYGVNPNDLKRFSEYAQDVIDADRGEIQVPSHADEFRTFRERSLRSLFHDTARFYVRGQ